MRGAAILALAGLTGCASDSPERATSPRALSARFTDRTVYGPPVASTDTLRGAFDWTNKRGWSVAHGSGLTTRFVQMGTTCYRRFDAEPWKRFKADDVDGLCDASTFLNPATSDDLLASVANDWHEVGSAAIRGVATKHYRGGLNIGAVKGTIEQWVDGNGVVRREVQRGENGDFVSVREYFDFGVRVRVRAPKVGANG